MIRQTHKTWIRKVQIFSTILKENQIVSSTAVTNYRIWIPPSKRTTHLFDLDVQSQINDKYYLKMIW